jgi:hypothetical protein
MLYLAAAILTFLLGLAHTVLGERYLLIPLFKYEEVPKLFGSRAFARRVFRFAWHLTTILMWALAVVILVLSLEGSVEVPRVVVWILAVCFLSCGVLSAVVTRLKHFSWLIFLTIGLLLWIG